MNNIFLANVDVIFGIARQNDKDVGVALSMFCKNLEARTEKYAGLATREAPDYDILGEAWSALSGEEQSVLLNDYREKVALLYRRLSELSLEERCAEMVALATEEDEWAYR